MDHYSAVSISLTKWKLVSAKRTDDRIYQVCVYQTVGNTDSHLAARVMIRMMSPMDFVDIVLTSVKEAKVQHSKYYPR